MEQWEKFEEYCHQYLSHRYKSAVFLHNGGFDSTTADIAVFKNSIHLFNMESKMPVAQSGQFVLLDKGGHFVFSDSNKSSEDFMASYIIRYINNHYDIYQHVSTAATPIDIDKSIFSSWIINHYQALGVRYVITAGDNNVIIFPITKYGDYFDITATLRKKKSGSRNLSHSALPDILQLLNRQYGACKIQFIGKKAYANLPYAINDKIKLYGCEYCYQLNREESGSYLIRVLSNTNNPNVIFSIKLISGQREADLKSFEQEIS